ncbi:MAG: hypothetical protein ABIL11_10715 [Chloroflexota bacterium]
MNEITELTLPLPLAFPFRQTLEMGLSTETRGTIKMIVVNGSIQAVSTNQEWFWKEEWQAGERKVDEYIKLGKYEEFDTMEEFLRTLRD